MNLIQTLNKEQADRLAAGKTIPDFEPGDTVIVNVKVVEGERTRIQAYEGVCIGRSGHGINESFTVRKISYGEGVERVFPLLSPMVDSIKLVRRGKVRRAKLLLPAQPARQVGAHRRGHAPLRPDHGRQRGATPPPKADRATFSPLFGRAYAHTLKKAGMSAPLFHCGACRQCTRWREREHLFRRVRTI